MFFKKLIFATCSLDAFNARAKELGVKPIDIKYPDGTVYGAVLPDGSMYLNPEKLNANTPIHEHTHLFNQVIQKTNPKLWNRMVEAVKGIGLWNEVKNDPNYANLKTDSQIADEVYSRLTGNKGEKNWQERIAKADSKSRLAKVGELIEEYWSDIKELFGVDIYKGMTADDFANMTLDKLFSGKDITKENPLKSAVRSVLESLFGKKALVVDSVLFSFIKDNEKGDTYNRNRFKKYVGEKNADYIKKRFSNIFSDSDNFIEFSKKHFPIKGDIVEALKRSPGVVERLYKNHLGVELDKNVEVNNVLTTKELLGKNGYKLSDVIPNLDIAKTLFYDYYLGEGSDERVSGSVICTMGDPRRFRENYVMWVVKENAENQPRATHLTEKNMTPEWAEYLEKNGRKNEDGTFNLNGLKDEREDPFSTSVLSIQIPKGSGKVNPKIISRYNHDLQKVGDNKNPDNVFGGDLNELAPNLKEAFEEQLGVELVNKSVSNEIQGFTQDNKGRYYKYTKEVNGVYYGEGFYIKNGETTLLDAGSQRMVGGFVINANGKVENVARESTIFYYGIIQKVNSINGNEISVTTENGDFVFETNNGDISKLKSWSNDEYVLAELGGEISKNGDITLNRGLGETGKRFWNDRIVRINGDAIFDSSQITSLGNLQSIGGNAYFSNSQITSLGNLQSIGGAAIFDGSQITSLGNLQSIGGEAYFRNSQITSLGNLQYIGGYADFRNSQITSLGNLQSIGGDAIFEGSQITSLGNLQSIGGEAIFEGSQITSLGNLQYIGGSAFFEGSQITSLGNLQYIGEDAYFYKSQSEIFKDLKTNDKQATDIVNIFKKAGDDFHESLINNEGKIFNDFLPDEYKLNEEFLNRDLLNESNDIRFSISNSNTNFNDNKNNTENENNVSEEVKNDFNNVLNKETTDKRFQAYGQEVTAEKQAAVNKILDFIKDKIKYFKDGKNIVVDAKEFADKLREFGFGDLRAMVSAWHGSPHDIQGGFRTDRIGTGEKSQAFGWGLYFTDLEDIARGYASKLKDTYETFAKEWKKEIKDDVLQDTYMFLLDAVKDRLTYDDLISKINDVINNKTNHSNKTKRFQKLLEFAKNNKDKYQTHLYKVTLFKGKQPSEYTLLEWDKPVTEDIIEKLKNAKNIPIKLQYILGIKEDPNIKFNNDKNIKIKELKEKRDKIIYERDNNPTKLVEEYKKEIFDINEEIRKINSFKTSQPIKKLDLSEYRGGELYLIISNAFGTKTDIASSLRPIENKDKNASLFLLENGIDGIKYPAESVSRGATSDTARGFNYVVFDENAVTIEEHIRFMSTPQGDVYGFVHEGKMYLNPNKLTPDLVGEEFIHLQQQGLRLAAESGNKEAKRIADAWDALTNDAAEAFMTDAQEGGISEEARDLLNLLGIPYKEMSADAYKRQDGESDADYKLRLQDELWAKAQKKDFAERAEKLSEEGKLSEIGRKVYEAVKDFFRFINESLGLYRPKQWKNLSLSEIIDRTNEVITSDKFLQDLKSEGDGQSATREYDKRNLFETQGGVKPTVNDGGSSTIDEVNNIDSATRPPSLKEAAKNLKDAVIDLFIGGNNNLGVHYDPKMEALNFYNKGGKVFKTFVDLMKSVATQAGVATMDSKGKLVWKEWANVTQQEKDGLFTEFRNALTRLNTNINIDEDGLEYLALWASDSELMKAKVKAISALQDEIDSLYESFARGETNRQDFAIKVQEVLKDFNRDQKNTSYFSASDIAKLLKAAKDVKDTASLNNFENKFYDIVSGKDFNKLKAATVKLKKAAIRAIQTIKNPNTTSNNPNGVTQGKERLALSYNPLDKRAYNKLPQVLNLQRLPNESNTAYKRAQRLEAERLYREDIRRFNDMLTVMANKEIGKDSAKYKNDINYFADMAAHQFNIKEQEKALRESTYDTDGNLLDIYGNIETLYQDLPAEYQEVADVRKLQFDNNGNIIDTDGNIIKDFNSLDEKELRELERRKKLEGKELNKIQTAAEKEQARLDNKDKIRSLINIGRQVLPFKEFQAILDDFLSITDGCELLMFFKKLIFATCPCVRL